MLQRLAIALGQIKASNTSKTLLNEIRSIVFLCIDQKIKRILKIVKHLIITSYYLISRQNRKIWKSHIRAINSKTSATTCNEQFELSDGYQIILDIY